ncbi:endonuclease domain-containing protein [Candidatus Margulisiibacteriota bacterium]
MVWKYSLLTTTVPSWEGVRGGKIRRIIIPYNPYLKELARRLRNNSTLSEILLWQKLKGKQMEGYDFDRKRPIDNFIVDFYCKDLKLAIEIDGDSHINKKEYDDQRQHLLEDLGVHFLRFLDIEVKVDLEIVLHKIRSWIQENRPTPKSPSRRGFS